jgi:hypothetical protein
MHSSFEIMKSCDEIIAHITLVLLQSPWENKFSRCESAYPVPAQLKHKSLLPHFVWPRREPAHSGTMS